MHHSIKSAQHTWEVGLIISILSWLRDTESSVQCHTASQAELEEG